MIYVRPLHAELMGTTALTPTQHKGGFKALIGIAVAIAIPFAAPAIATAIGFSGSLLASTLVGAALGAATAGLTGGNVLLGAAGGGLGGFAGGGGFSGITGGGVGPLGGVGIDAAGGAAFGPSVGGPASAGLTSSFDFATGAGAQFDAFGNVNPLAIGSDPTGFTGGFQGQGSISDTLGGGSGGSVSGGGSGDTFTSFSGADGPFTTAADGVIPNQQVSFDISPANTGGGVAPSLARGNVINPASSGGSEGGFFDGFGNRLSAAASKAFSPDKLLEVGGKFALSKLSEAFADEVPVSREEEQRLAFLDQQRANQLRLQGKKEDISNTFLAQAGTISPLQRGQEALALEQDRLLRAQQAGLRGINPRNTGAVAAQRRKDALNKSRLGAFQRGQEGGRLEQQQLVSRAAANLPSGAGIASGASADLAAANDRYLRLQQEQRNVGGVFSDIFTDLNVDSDKENEDARNRRN